MRHGHHTNRTDTMTDQLEPGTRVMVATHTYGTVRPYTLRADDRGFYVRCGKRGAVKEYLIRRDQFAGLTTYRSVPADSDAWKNAERKEWMGR